MIDSDYHRIIEGLHAKTFEARQLFVYFSKVFHSIRRKKMEQIQLAFSVTKESVTTVITLYKNMKAMVFSPEGNTNFFDNVAC